MTPLRLRSLSDLSRPDARLALAMIRFCREELGVDLHGARVLVALSGGADSTALLALCCALRDPLKLTVLAAHADHALRPESAQEAREVAALCAQLDVPLDSVRLEGLAETCPPPPLRTSRDPVPQGAPSALPPPALSTVRPSGPLQNSSSEPPAPPAHGPEADSPPAFRRPGLEARARELRYAFLEDARQRRGAAWILTAHHVGDLAEDVLLRLTRGASWPGLGGMKGLGGPGGHVLRPLLLQEKERLQELLRRLGLSWAEDASNADLSFRRNRMRHALLPLFLAENPAFLKEVRQLWRMARKDEEFWAQRLEGCLIPAPGGCFLAASDLAALPPAGRLRAYAAAIRALSLGQARADTLFALDAAWSARRFPRTLLFPGGVRAVLNASGVRFLGPEAEKPEEGDRS